MATHFGPSGRFRLLEELGPGTLGTSWRAFDEDAQVPVCLKILSPSLAGDMVVQARLAVELNEQGQIDHPDLVPFAGSLRDGDAVGLYRAYAEGPDLAELAARQGGALSLDVALPLFDRLLAAFEAAHRLKLAHLALGPDNLYLVGDGPETRLAVTDFGLPRLLGHRKYAQARNNRPYLAPEQRSDAPLPDLRSDLYALGALLRGMLVGGLESPRQARRPVVPPPSLPAPLDRLIQRATHQDSGRRWPTAADIRVGLREALSEMRSSVSLPLLENPPDGGGEDITIATDEVQTLSTQEIAMLGASLARSEPAAGDVLGTERDTDPLMLDEADFEDLLEPEASPPARPLAAQAGPAAAPLAGGPQSSEGKALTPGGTTRPTGGALPKLPPAASWASPSSSGRATGSALPRAAEAPATPVVLGRNSPPHTPRPTANPHVPPAPPLEADKAPRGTMPGLPRPESEVGLRAAPAGAAKPAEPPRPQPVTPTADGQVPHTATTKPIPAAVPPAAFPPSARAGAMAAPGAASAPEAPEEAAARPVPAAPEGAETHPSSRAGSTDGLPWLGHALSNPTPASGEAVALHTDDLVAAEAAPSVKPALQATLFVLLGLAVGATVGFFAGRSAAPAAPAAEVARAEGVEPAGSDSAPSTPTPATEPAGVPGNGADEGRSDALAAGPEGTGGAAADTAPATVAALASAEGSAARLEPTAEGTGEVAAVAAAAGERVGEGTGAASAQPALAASPADGLPAFQPALFEPGNLWTFRYTRSVPEGEPDFLDLEYFVTWRLETATPHPVGLQLAFVEEGGISPPRPFEVLASASCLFDNRSQRPEVCFPVDAAGLGTATVGGQPVPAWTAETNGSALVVSPAVGWVERRQTDRDGQQAVWTLEGYRFGGQQAGTIREAPPMCDWTEVLDDPARIGNANRPRTPELTQASLWGLRGNVSRLRAAPAGSAGSGPEITAWIDADSTFYTIGATPLEAQQAPPEGQALVEVPLPLAEIKLWRALDGSADFAALRFEDEGSARIDLIELRPDGAAQTHTLLPLSSAPGARANVVLLANLEGCFAQVRWGRRPELQHADYQLSAEGVQRVGGDLPE